MIAGIVVLIANAADGQSISVDASKTLGPLPHVWRSTGWSSSMWMLRDDMKQHLAYYGAVPHDGMKYIAPQLMFDLIQIHDPGTPEQRLDFELFDEAMDFAVKKNGMRMLFICYGQPFELDKVVEDGKRKTAGHYHDIRKNPPGYFPLLQFATPFRDLDHAREYGRFVAAVVRHCTQRYGRDEIKTWFFQGPNEPRPRKKSYEKNLWIGWDAAADGVKSVDPDYVWGWNGSPRRRFWHDPIPHTWTGKISDVHLDFTADHIKRLPRRMISDEAKKTDSLDWYQRRRENLRDLQFMNGEADAVGGWSAHYWWRGDPWYASFMGAHIALRQRDVIAKYGTENYALASTDNGFMGRFGQRTLLAMWNPKIDHVGDPNDPRLIYPRRQTFSTVKKPAFTIYSLLALLGDQHVSHTAAKASDDTFVLASRRGADVVAVLIANHPTPSKKLLRHDRPREIRDAADQWLEANDRTVTVSLKNLPFDRGRIALFQIDASHGNPFGVYRQQGSPERPSAEQLSAMRRAAEPELVRNDPIDDGLDEIKIAFDGPGAALLLVHRDPGKAPGQVTGLWHLDTAGLNGEREIMLRWAGVGSYALKHYEVEMDGEIVQPRSLDEGQLISVKPGRDVTVRVRAVDLWDRHGAWSDPYRIQATDE